MTVYFILVLKNTAITLKSNGFKNWNTQKTVKNNNELMMLKYDVVTIDS